ncbi:hypothetical protein D9756_002425 [Leucocoprinus leucothites]|uniref:Uncharacterized protein n=1 Tax=Leucocoprinus leucothites TaxID=201217 RepID=A0A8H5GBK2_9AGAR|nr:hypothetical protein D9756_002425 [Leucoagaricus leucothites]
MSNRFPPVPGYPQQNGGKGVSETEALKRRIEEVEYRNRVLKAENEALKEMMTKSNKKWKEKTRVLEAENKDLKQKLTDHNAVLDMDARKLKERDLAARARSDSKSQLKSSMGQNMGNKVISEDKLKSSDVPREWHQRPSSSSPRQGSDEPDPSNPSSWYDEYKRYEC